MTHLLLSTLKMVSLTARHVLADAVNKQTNVTFEIVKPQAPGFSNHLQDMMNKLPQTGEARTMLYVVVGLIICGAVLVIKRRKRHKE